MVHLLEWVWVWGACGVFVITIVMAVTKYNFVKPGVRVCGIQEEFDILIQRLFFGLVSASVWPATLFCCMVYGFYKFIVDSLCDW